VAFRPKTPLLAQNKIGGGATFHLGTNPSHYTFELVFEQHRIDCDASKACVPVPAEA
jgi:hypothetical protein